MKLMHWNAWGHRAAPMFRPQPPHLPVQIDRLHRRLHPLLPHRLRRPLMWPELNHPHPHDLLQRQRPSRHRLRRLPRRRPVHRVRRYRAAQLQGHAPRRRLLRRLPAPLGPLRQPLSPGPPTTPMPISSQQA
jgi:hypothetical protein